jgi:hypothetical protein
VKILRLLTAAVALVTASCSSIPGGSLSGAGTPGQATINPGAGRGESLSVTIRGPRGEPWKFIVDTGAPDTMLDRSLEPLLGPVIRTERVHYGYFGTRSVKVFAAPRLTLGGAPLRTGREVLTDNFATLFPRRHIKGILGMDCLRHYVLQIDFGRGSLRLLDPARAPGGTLGRPHRMRSEGGAIHVEGDLFGLGRREFRVDTGCTIDAVLERPLFDRVLHAQKPIQTRTFPSPAGRPIIECIFAAGTFDGHPYGRLVVDGADDNLLGVRFLARHGVTFDFPRNTLYLR